ncbi:MAG TPA: HDOD domain-containing protein [Polyangiales bacterium]|nr:HDOD domain-containing protein [Polyangiales bacterium]
MKQSAASQAVSPDRSIAAWFRRLFGLAPANTQTTPLQRSPAAGSGQRPAPGQAHGQPAKAAPEELAAMDEAWGDHAPEFKPYAHALGLPFALPPELTDEQLELMAQLSTAVTEFASKDDNGPKSLPTASLRILNLVAQNDVEVTELSSAINQDPALMTAVLRVANSALLGGTGQIATVRDAVTRLGIAETGRVAGAVAAKTLFSAKSKSAHALFSASFLDLHVAAAAAAGGAAFLAMERAVGRSDLAYLGGMLHDVGKSLALGAIASLVLDNKAPREIDPEVIFIVLESLHVELGAEAHDRWALPQYLTTLCASHHDSTVPNHPSQAELHLVRVVSGLLALRTRPQPLERISELMQSIQVLGLTPVQTRALDAELRRNTSRMRDALV